MKKRILAMLLSVIMLIGILPVSALAVKEIASGKCGDNLTWKLTDDGVLTISGEGPMADLFNGNPNATDIAWSKYRSDIKIVVVEEGVTSISDNSFRNYINVTELRIPASVSVIGDYAFEGCKELQRFVVDKNNDNYCNDKQGLLYTKDMQLLKCAPYAVDEMVLPRAVLEIAYDAFSDGDCENVIRFVGDVITYYGTTIYDNTIYYPGNNPTWTEAIKGAYGSNTWIEYIPDETVVEASGECGENLTWQLTDDGVLTISGEGEMDEYLYAPWYDYRDEILSVVIENGAENISRYAFADLTMMKIVVIPDSVTIIDDQAFYWCTSLVSVEIPNNVKTIGWSAFEYCTSLKSVTIPASVTEIGVYAFEDCTSLEKFIVDENNSHFSSDEYGVLFNKDKSELLKAPIGSMTGSYTIPDGVIQIGYWAFIDCKNLESVVIPDSVVRIDSNAFTNCASLSEITIPESVISIGVGAFVDCDNLTSVTIPAGVTEIDDAAFGRCDRLQEIIVDEENDYFSNDSNGVLFDKEKTELIQYPNGKKGEDYTVPSSVTSIRNSAFSNSSISSVILPDDLVNIGDWAFYECRSLKSVVIPESVLSIGFEAFDLCSFLSEIWFEGDFPYFEGDNILLTGDVTIYYPENNPTWTKEAMDRFYTDEITWIPYTTEDRLQGDVDSNGEISNTDLVSVARYIVELYDENTVADIEKYGDMNGDGMVNNNDLVSIARIIVGI